MQQPRSASAKLSMPRTVAAVRRERLLRLIEEAPSAVWIAAPPGAGKTTLAASYAASVKRPTLWYRLDGGDADPATFFHFLGLAAAQAAPRRRIALPSFTPEYLPDLPGFARRFFRTLFGRLPAGSLLVLDNFHELDGAPLLHDIVREAAGEIPAGGRIIIVSRGEPPAAMARLCANRELILLGWDELRLTVDETRALAGVDEAAARRLHAQSGGWAAGVILLRHSGGGDQRVRLSSQQSVFDYFAAEILGKVSAAARDVLVRTAFFPDFTAAMAQSVCPGADAGTLLAGLCRQHCFVDRSGTHETSYRYHDLFRDFLRAQAGAQAPAFRRAAALVLAERGRASEAVPLRIENGDWQDAAGIIVGQAQRLIVQGRWQTLAGWIDALPEDMRAAAPWLLFWRGVAELPVHPRNARLLIERAFDRFCSDNDLVGQMLAAAAVIEANFYEWSDFAALDKWVGVIESLGGVRIAFPTPELEARVLTAMLMALGHRRSNYADAQRLVDRLETLLDADIGPNQKATTLSFMLWHTYWTGDFAQVRRIHAVAGRLLGQRAMTPLNDVLLRCMKGQCELFLGDAAGADEVFDAAEAIALRHVAFARGSAVLPLQAYRRLSFGDLAAAERAIEEAARAPFSGPMNAAQDAFARSWLALQRGNLQRAADHVRAAVDLAERSGSFVAGAWNQAAWALVHISAGDVDAAQPHIDAARAILAGCSAGLLPYHLKLVEAWLALRRGDAAACHPLLRDAFAYAARHGLANTLQWLPRMMSELCAEALRAGIETDYVRWLIAKRRLPPPATAPETWPWPLRIRTLGTFEVHKDGALLEFPRKLPKKPIALLKALIALGGQGVAEARLIDALWPDGEAADDALAVSVHRLRKLLGDADAIRVQGGRIALNADVCWVDAWTFERLAERSEAAAAAGRLDACQECARQVLALYRGAFLADDVDESWAISPRERLRMKFVHHVAATAKFFCARKECELAIASCRRGLDTDDLIEGFYQELMRCYGCLGRDGEGQALYRRMQRTFATVLGQPPSAASEALYRTLQRASPTTTAPAK